MESMEKTIEKNIEKIIETFETPNKKKEWLERLEKETEKRRNKREKAKEILMSLYTPARWQDIDPGELFVFGRLNKQRPNTVFVKKNDDEYFDLDGKTRRMTEKKQQRKIFVVSTAEVLGAMTAKPDGAIADKLAKIVGIKAAIKTEYAK